MNVLHSLWEMVCAWRQGRGAPAAQIAQVWQQCLRYDTQGGTMLDWHPNRDLCGVCDQELVRLGLAPGPEEWQREMILEDMLGLPIETAGPCWLIYPTNDAPPQAALLMEDQEEPVCYDVQALSACLRRLPDATPLEGVKAALATLPRLAGEQCQRRKGQQCNSS
jgi:hypothetical protein